MSGRGRGKRGNRGRGGGVNRRGVCRAPRRQRGIVYVFTSADYKRDNTYKIGSTMDVRARLSTLNTGYAYSDQAMYCLHQWEVFLKNDYKDVEKYIHGEFENKRLEGEFFKLSSNDLKKLQQLMDKLGKRVRSNYT